MSLNIKDALIKARISLLLDRCFWGNLALHLPLKEDNSVPTFATDGKCIMYNKEFAEKCSDRDREFIVAHEVAHNIFFHLIRKGDREHERWNLAIDFATNAILNKEFHFVPEGGLYNEEFENMTAEEIYNKLPEMNGKGKNGYRRYEKGDIKIEIDAKGNIKINGKEVKPFDVHKDIKGSKQELDELEKEWAIQVSKAWQQAKMAGKLPAGMDVFIEQLLAPKLDWRNMLRQFIITSAKSGFSWLPSNRRFIHQDVYMPSITGESLGDVAVIMDVSGSTGGKAQQQFLSECNGLLQQFEMNLHLLTTDVEVTSHHQYNQGDEIRREYKGLGGTELKNAFQYISDKRINPSVVVILTDGFTDLNFTSKFPALWVITKDGIDLDKVPFGMRVKMND